MVLAVAHPWASAPSYLSSQSLAAPAILAATFMPPRGRPTHSRRSPSCRFLLCVRSTWSTWSAVINRTPRTRELSRVCFLSFFSRKSDESENEAAGERTTRVGRPRGGMKVTARIYGKTLSHDTRQGDCEER